jgi:hypothetical protein
MLSACFVAYCRSASLKPSTDMVYMIAANPNMPGLTSEPSSAPIIYLANASYIRKIANMNSSTPPMKPATFLFFHDHKYVQHPSVLEQA